ncbi:MAG: preprotein translocase subunit YajC [Actinobacteria bacterium]|nr:preprotein translocase subunit YajC [Actinomycetota bacterium]
MDPAFTQILILGLLFGVFYFMLIRPQKKRAQTHRNLIESVEVGDEVVTIGGLHGRVTRVGEDDLDIEAAPGTNLKFVKSAIARKLTEDEDEDEEIGATSEEE